MELAKDTLRALSLLYGGTGEPVCAADDGLQLLWQSGTRTEELVHLLGMQLCEGGGRLCIPKEGTVLLRSAEPPMCCHVQKLSQDGIPYYLLRFLPPAEPRTLNPAEMRALVEAQAEICGTAAVVGIQSFRRLEQALQEKGGTMEPSARKLHCNACYSLLNVRLRCRELFDYAADDDEIAACPSVDLAGELERICQEIRRAVSGTLPIAAVQLAPALYAAVDTERFRVAILLLLTRLLIEDGMAAPALAVEAVREGDLLRIRLTLQPTEPQETGGRTASYIAAEKNGTLTADHMLLRRFCDRYHGSFAVCTGDGAHFAELTLPAAAPPECISLHTDIDFYESGCFTLTHILLSTAISPECFFESKSDDMQ